jgi:hypothetical protein
MNPIELLLGLGSKLIDNLFPDPAVAADAKLKLLELQQNGVLAQITAQTDVNKVEASNPSMFVAGARPFIMWICGLGLGMQFLVAPLLTWGSTLIGHPVALPPLDMGTLITLLGGMLGLGGLRTAEKIQGVARNSL